MKHRFLCILVILLALVTVLASCSAASPNDGAIGDPGEYENNASGTDSPAAGGAVNPGDLFGDYDRKIIRTVHMACESKAYDDAVTTVMTALATHGGYVESSSATGGLSRSTDKTASARRSEYTLRIPAENLDAFLESLRTDGNIHITDQSMKSDEITGAYYDTQTRIETLTAEKNSLSAMLEGFTDYSDISAMLEVQRRLYDVIEEIETLQTKLNLYDSQVALSTVHLTLREVIEYTETAEPTFLARIGDAFVESWTDFGRGWQNFAVWFVEAFPTLLILGAIATAITLIVRRSVKKSKAKKNASP